MIGEDGIGYPRQGWVWACVAQAFVMLTLWAAPGRQTASEQLRPVPLKSAAPNVQPMTGIVMWEGSRNCYTDAIQLEFSYLRYSDVVKAKGEYDWGPLESKLAAAAARGHQLIVRFWDTYPGHPTGVPDYIKDLPDYKETLAKSEGRDTWFPDWSHAEYQRFVLEFYAKLAERFDHDPRLAFLETGFGLWAEYHIYSGPEELGLTFPSLEFQATFLRHLAEVFRQTPWLISQDAHVPTRAPFSWQPELLQLRFGIFDDSFHLAWKAGYNLRGWEFFGRDRFRRAPAGGEILIPNEKRARLVEANWTEQARNFGITFMIGEQWPRFVSTDRIRELGKACGYKFRITSFEAGEAKSRVTVLNCGVAPIYYDAYVAVNGVRASQSLKYLQPGEDMTVEVASGGSNPTLTIECDRLVPGQRIEYEADLP